MAAALLRHRNGICRALREALPHLNASAGCKTSQKSFSCLQTEASALLVAASNNYVSQRPTSSLQPFGGRRHDLSASHQHCRRIGAEAQPMPSEEDITLTENAIEKLHELCKGREEHNLRLTVEAGGCSGFSYKFDLDTAVNDGDRIFEADGVRLVADSMSYEFVRGSKVDYSQELIKSSFEVVDNPNADKGCGCGTSFSPK